MIKCGLVGMPNIGKSTIFNTILGSNIANVGDYPFCTIEPNISEVEVRDQNIDRLAKFYNSEKIIYPKIKFIDIAGLIQGASNGAGLGNKFLSHIHAVDLIVHVVGIFQTANFNRTPDDALSNIYIINEELILSDIELCDNMINNRKNRLKQTKTTIDLLDRALCHLNSDKMIIEGNFTQDEILHMQKLGLITAKPMIYVFNLEEGKSIPQTLNQFIPSVAVYPNSSQTNLDVLISTAYTKTGLITFYTAGPKESRGWKILNHTTAKEAAGVIHTDLSSRFIAAEISSVEDVIENRRPKMQGKNYVMNNGDVCYFKAGRS